MYYEIFLVDVLNYLAVWHGSFETFVNQKHDI